MAASRGSLGCNPVAPLGQNTISTPDQLYKKMVNCNRPINQFTSTYESIGDTVSVWTLFSHVGIYVMAIELLIPAGLGIFWCVFFWCGPARLVCWPLQSGST